MCLWRCARAQPPATTVDLTTPRSAAKKPATPQGKRSRPGAGRDASAGSERAPSADELDTRRSGAIEFEVEAARRRLREIESLRSVSGLQQKFNSLKDEADENPPRGYDRSYVLELDAKAHDAFREAALLPRGQAGDGWRKAEELFYQALQALGRQRADVQSEIAAEQEAIREANKNTNAEKLKRIRVKWRKYRTMIFTMLAIDKQNAAKVKEVAADLLRQYEEVEPDITGYLEHQVQAVGGQLKGLEYKLKSESSLFRKIMSDLDEEKQAETGLDVIGVAAKCYDVLRYTCILDTPRYVDGTTKILANLDGHKAGTLETHQFRVKNFWGKGDAYQGINSVYKIIVDGETLYFELQFHTPESIATKEESCHVSYEAFRTAHNQEDKAACWEEMVSVWDLVPVPKGVLTIPKLFQGEFEFDMSKMTETEKHLISHRKRLETKCSYTVAEVHARAIEAEPLVTTLLDHLIDKHGHHDEDNIVMRDRDKRMTGELTIRREAVQTLTAKHYPARSGDGGEDLKLIRYKSAGEGDPPTSDVFVYGGQIDDTIVHQVIFDQVRAKPPLKYLIEVRHEIYFTTGVQQIIKSFADQQDMELCQLDNWFAETSERHRGIEATFHHFDTGVYIRVIFHTPATYASSADMQKALAAAYQVTVSGKGDSSEDMLKRQQHLMSLAQKITVPPRVLTVGEVRYNAIEPRGDGPMRLFTAVNTPPTATLSNTAVKPVAEQKTDEMKAQLAQLSSDVAKLAEAVSDSCAVRTVTYCSTQIQRFGLC